MLSRVTSLALAARRVPLSPLAPSVRLFSSGQPTSGKWSSPTTDPDANRKRADYDGTAEPKDKVPLEQENQRKGQQSKAAEDAERAARHGGSAPKQSTTPASKEERSRKQSGTKGDSTPADKHRNSKEFAHRDQGTGSEASVAADRAGEDPLPDAQKHSEKLKNGKSA